MDRDTPSYVQELRNRYVAVRKKLYGIKGPTGVIPPAQMPIPPENIDDSAEIIAVDAVNKSILLRIPNASPRLMRLIREVADNHGIDPQKIVHKGRKPAVVLARWEVYTRAYLEQGLSYNRLGFIFGTDHTTVMHGVSKFLELSKDIGSTESGLTVGNLT